MADQRDSVCAILHRDLNCTHLRGCRLCKNAHSKKNPPGSLRGSVYRDLSVLSELGTPT